MLLLANIFLPFAQLIDWLATQEEVEFHHFPTTPSKFVQRPRWCVPAKSAAWKSCVSKLLLPATHVAYASNRTPAVRGYLWPISRIVSNSDWSACPSQWQDLCSLGSRLISILEPQFKQRGSDSIKWETPPGLRLPPCLAWSAAESLARTYHSDGD